MPTTVSQGNTDNTDSSEARAAAKDFLHSSNLLHEVASDIGLLGIARNRKAVTMFYVTGVSARLRKPLHGRIHGESSSGKSESINAVANLFPEGMLVRATSITPNAFYFTTADFWSNKFVICGERSRLKDEQSQEATRALREMQEQGYVTKIIPEKVNGRMVSRHIRTDGPIASVESTTDSVSSIFNEDRTRYIALHADESQDCTGDVYIGQAEAVQECNGRNLEAMIAKHHALHRMLKTLPVRIPYAVELAKLFPRERVVGRRVFKQTLTAIQAVTLLYQLQRKTDKDGNLIATDEDYDIVHDLLADHAREAMSGCGQAAIGFYRNGLAVKYAVGAVFNTNEAIGCDPEGRGKPSITGYLNALRGLGGVTLVEPSNGNVPARWRLEKPNTGGELPELPELGAGLVGGPLADAERVRSGAFKWGGVNAQTPVKTA